MPTILNRLVERLDYKIARLKRARKMLQEKNLEDSKLEHQIDRLLSIRNRLHKKNSTGDSGIDSALPAPPSQTIL